MSTYLQMLRKPIFKKKTADNLEDNWTVHLTDTRLERTAPLSSIVCRVHAEVGIIRHSSWHTVQDSKRSEIEFWKKMSNLCYDASKSGSTDDQIQRK